MRGARPTEQIQGGLIDETTQFDEALSNICRRYPRTRRWWKPTAASSADAPHPPARLISISRFIKKIATENLLGSARTILESTAGRHRARMSRARTAKGLACWLRAQAYPIGRLQRYATDYVLDGGIDIFKQCKPTGKKVAGSARVRRVFRARANSPKPGMM
jgi:hypothetical protein